MPYPRRAFAVASEHRRSGDRLDRQVAPNERTTTAATSGSCRATRPIPDVDGTRSSRPRASTIVSPTPVITAAMPRPKTHDEDEPERRPPATIEPSRMNRALVEGIRPPARPRAKRPRQLSVEPSAGTWLWADAAVRVRCRRWVVLVLVLVLVRDAPLVGRGVGGGLAAAVAAPHAASGPPRRASSRPAPRS
jgi:hypothetical protein